MKDEIHLFILWKNALYKKEDIMQDIRKKFEILNIYNMTWSDEFYSQNLSRFYGTKLPDNSAKEKHCGRGMFLLIIVKDKKPKYDYRDTSNGKQFVNVNMFDSKSLYRKWTGGGHKVHATNSTIETNHDLTLLLDKNILDYLNEIEINPDEPITIYKDLFGARGFEKIKDMFYALNNCVNYALLRNYEILPDDIYMNEHNDIDLICESKENVAYVLNAQKVQKEDYRVQYSVKVENKIANFDLRYIGDKYYDEELEKEILNNRVFNRKGFYTLSKEDYFYTLLYHALIHKPEFKDDYKKRLKKMNKNFDKSISNSIEASVNFLQKWLIEKFYIIEKPLDYSVYFNEENLYYMSKLVYRKSDKSVEKKMEELENLNKSLTEELNLIKSSKGWKLITFIRKIKSKISN